MLRKYIQDNAIIYIMENFESRSPITIGAITPNDVEGVKKVYYESWLDTYPNEKAGVTREDIEFRFKDYFKPESIQKIKDALENIPENESFFVAKESQKIVGVCKVLRSEEESRLKSIYVLPGFQGKGIGTKLWEQAKLTLDLEKPIYVALADYNEQARAFYEKLGFVDTGKRWADENNRMQSGAIIPEMDMVLEPSDMN